MYLERKVMVRAIFGLLMLMLLAPAASAQFRQGLYECRDELGARWTMEVRAIDTSEPKIPKYSVIVSCMPQRNIIDIAPVQSKNPKYLNTVAGYRGEQKHYEIVRVEVDPRGTPISLEYYNDLNVEQAVHVRCANLRFVQNPNRDDLTVE